MIRSLTIAGFKRFLRQDFELAPLTVLTGLNGTGKTTFLHALMLAREASCTGERTVRLNGPFGLELGTAVAVRNWDAGDEIETVVTDDAGRTHRWAFRIPAEEKALFLAVDARPEAPPTAFTSKPRAFTYLCAERLGPRSLLGSSALPDSDVDVGVQGEFCAQLLAVVGDRQSVYADRYHPASGPSGGPRILKYDLERWLSDVVRPVELKVDTFPGVPVSALSFRVPGGDWVKAPNMGFGVSYALPVLLAGLVACPDGMLLVENPEAHLHPSGQSRMGFFLAWLAAHGVQVVVETHSDHVLNGVRRAIGEDHVLPAASAIAHYFDAGEGDSPRVTALRFGDTGGVSSWPRGFFDQYQIDVVALTRAQRKR